MSIKSIRTPAALPLLAPVLRLLPVPALVLILSSCASNRYSLDEKPQSYIIMGSGGGFTNLVASTYVYPNGQVFETQTFVDSTISHPNIKRTHTKRLFKDLEASKLKEIKFSQPGNTYLFLTYVTEGEKYYFSWDAGGKLPPKEVSEFYIRISELTNPE